MYFNIVDFNCKIYNSYLYLDLNVFMFLCFYVFIYVSKYNGLYYI